MLHYYSAIVLPIIALQYYNITPSFLSRKSRASALQARLTSLDLPLLVSRGHGLVFGLRAGRLVTNTWRRYDYLYKTQ